MPRGYWCILVALVGLSLTAAEQPAKQQHGQTATQQAQPAKPTQPPYAAYPDKYSDACYAAKDHDAADLCAQWRAALATEKAAHEARRATFWSIVATILTFATVVGLIVTISQTFGALGEARRGNVLSMRENARATRRAVVSAKETAAALDAANKSADAAAGQVVIAQEAAYRQLRAYISIEDVKVTQVTNDWISGDLTIRNAGQTPAAIELYFASYIGNYPVLKIADEAPAPISFTFHGPYINANSSEVVTWFYQLDAMKPQQDAKAEIARAIAEPIKFALYVYGRIEFVDFKRHKRVLKYSFRNEGALTLGKVGDRMIPTPYGNEYEDLDREV